MNTAEVDKLLRGRTVLDRSGRQGEVLNADDKSLRIRWTDSEEVDQYVLDAITRTTRA